jgi:hypothetical protein
MREIYGNYCKKFTDRMLSFVFVCPGWQPLAPKVARYARNYSCAQCNRPEIVEPGWQFLFAIGADSRGKRGQASPRLTVSAFHPRMCMRVGGVRDEKLRNLPERN